MATRRNNWKWLWWGTGILIVALVTVSVVLVVKNNTDSSRPDNEEQNNSKEEEIPEKKEEQEKTEEQSTEEPEEEKVKQYDGENPNKSENLTGVISYAGVSGGNLMIRVNIDQYLAGGNCKLNLIKNNATIYNSTVEIESSVSTSTCKGFNIPTAGLPSGTVTIEIALESDGKYGKIVGEATI